MLLITGKPATLYDNTNPDWVPSLLLTASKTQPQHEEKYSSTPPKSSKAARYVLFSLDD
jgi:hypothetical protein